MHVRDAIVLAVSAVVIVGCSPRKPVSATTTRPALGAVSVVPATQSATTRPLSAGLGRRVSQYAILPKLDGTAGGTCIPMYSARQLAQVDPSHKWNGIADLGAEVKCGWTEEGIVVLANVRDDEVINTKAGGNLWQQDCFELFIDGRPNKGFMSSTYSPGAYQILVKPPMDGKDPVAVIANGATKIEGLRVSGTPTVGGYALDILIPWSAFGATRPADVAMAFQIDEYDSRDAKGMRSAVLAQPTRGDLYQSPANWTAFQLADRFYAGDNVGPAIQSDAPAVIANKLPASVTVTLGRNIAEKAKTVAVILPSAVYSTHPLAKAGFSVRGGEGVSAPVTLTDSDGLATATAQVPFPPVNIGPGASRIVPIVIVAFDADGKPLATSRQDMVVVGSAVDQALAAIEKANVAQLAQQDPFRAAAWLGAASAVDRLRQAAASNDPVATLRRMDEVDTRLAIVRGIPARGNPAMLHDMLTLAASPDSEVVVEYPRPDVGTVVFNYGAIPLGSVTVERMPGATEAGILEGMASHVHASRVKLGRLSALGRRDVVVQSVWDNTEPVDAGELDSHRDLFLWTVGEQEIQVLTKDELALMSSDAVVQIVNGHTEPATAAANWADAKNIPTRMLNDLQGAKRVLLVGDARQVPQFASARYVRVFPRIGATQMAVASGDRVLWSMAPNADIAAAMLRLVVDGKPISAGDVDSLRRKFVSALAPGIKPQAAADLWCGDLHMHTFYSDGNSSPATNMLQAMYVMQDFSVMTDHNTVAGAMRARQLLTDAGFAYPQIVGEEFTSNYHANIFPVESAIMPPMQPQELIALTHQQGSFIQWNHPGFPGWGHAYLASGFETSGFDAWEHMPARYDLWQAQGKCPLFTGTTDTHDGTFGTFPERTIIFANSPDGKVLAQALRDKYAVAVWPEGGALFYGPGDCVKRAWAALAEGKAMKVAKAAKIRAILAKAKPAQMVQQSETSRQEEAVVQKP